jgi:hypothetical protein
MRIFSIASGECFRPVLASLSRALVSSECVQPDPRVALPTIAALMFARRSSVNFLPRRDAPAHFIEQVFRSRATFGFTILVSEHCGQVNGTRRVFAAPILDLISSVISILSAR